MCEWDNIIRKLMDKASELRNLVKANTNTKVEINKSSADIFEEIRKMKYKWIYLEEALTEKKKLYRNGRSVDECNPSSEAWRNAS